MTPISIESTSQMDHVWSLLNMAVDDKTRKTLEDELEIEDIFDFQLITESILDNLPAGTPKKGRRKVCHLFLFRDHLAKTRKMGILTVKTSPKKYSKNFKALLCPILRSGATKHGSDENEDNVTNKQLESLSMLSKLVQTNTPT